MAFEPIQLYSNSLLVNFEVFHLLTTYHRYSFFVPAKVVPQVVSGKRTPGSQAFNVIDLFTCRELLAGDDPRVLPERGIGRKQ